MIEVYMTHEYDDNIIHLDINFDTRIRGHTKKLVVRRCRYDVRRYSGQLMYGIVFQMTLYQLHQ